MVDHAEPAAVGLPADKLGGTAGRYGRTIGNEFPVGSKQGEVAVPGRGLASLKLDAAPRIFYGKLTPRQRPNRHGRYQCAPWGRASGTLSIPEVPQGWQRNSRANVIQPPPQSPKRPIASSA